MRKRELLSLPRRAVGIELTVRPSSSSLEPATLSKAAKKRARQAAKLAEEAVKTVAESDVVQSVTASVQANGSASKTNGESEKPLPKAVSTKPAPSKEYKAKLEAPAQSSLSTPIPSKEATSSKINGEKSDSPPSPLPSLSKLAESLPTPKSPPQSDFKPQLPQDLPEPSSTALSANRKRKTPQDFTPAGPRDVSTAQSPSKSSVKFEDGLAPGEGVEGEKTIPSVKSAVAAVPKKNQNMVERTVWTFIMMAGFVGKSLTTLSRCDGRRKRVDWKSR